MESHEQKNTKKCLESHEQKNNKKSLVSHEQKNIKKCLEINEQKNIKKLLESAIVKYQENVWKVMNRKISRIVWKVMNRRKKNVGKSWSEISRKCLKSHEQKNIKKCLEVLKWKIKSKIQGKCLDSYRAKFYGNIWKVMKNIAMWIKGIGGKKDCISVKPTSALFSLDPRTIYWVSQN